MEYFHTSYFTLQPSGDISLESGESGSGEYQIGQFQGSDRILSPALPELKVTAEKIFQAAFA